jgi:acyl-CoA thioesterase YciA
MQYRSRRLVRHEHLNPRGTLFGGTCMQWIDEEAAIYVICQLGTKNIVTKLISEINFISPAHLGDIVEFGMNVVSFGTTSITVECVVRIKETGNVIVRIDKMVFVSVDADGHPTRHKLAGNKIEEL